MTLSIIVARAENGVIGRDGGLPWRLPADLARFKRITTGHPIVMGRRTFESIGHPLPERTSIVVSRRADTPVPEGVRLAGSLAAALAAAREAPGAEEVFVIGGASLYAAALPRADRLYETLVHAAVPGDTRFPPLDEDAWTVVAEEHRPADARHAHALTFRIRERRPA